MAFRSTTVIVFNKSNAVLALTTSSLAHGVWTTDLLPPQQIAAGSLVSPATATWGSESQGLLTGTEGQAVYTFPDGQTTVTFYWDNPAGGSNGYNISFGGPGAATYAGSYAEGDGNNATVHFTITSV